MASRAKSGAVAGGRGIRVADQLQRELAQQIQFEVKDPRIGLVTLTGVDLTPDYAVATVGLRSFRVMTRPSLEPRKASSAQLLFCVAALVGPCEYTPHPNFGSPSIAQSNAVWRCRV